MAPPTNVSALLFDLGGVIIDIDFSRAIRRWSEFSRLSFAELENLFSMDDAFQRHERGEIECREYFAHLRDLLELEASDDEIEQGWNAIFVDQIEATVEYIAAVRDHLPCYAFTNSNATHQGYWTERFAPAIGVFEEVFVSSEMGLRKPERAAFAAISAATGKRLEEILFFDDNEENVTGARLAGMQAVHVSSHMDVEQALADIGVLQASDSRARGRPDNNFDQA